MKVIGSVIGIFHPTLTPQDEKKTWHFREDEFDDVSKGFLNKPVYYEHRGAQIGIVRNIFMSNDRGKNLLCEIDIFETGQSLMTRMENGETLALSVRFSAGIKGTDRVSSITPLEISIVEKAGMISTLIVANKSNNGTRISRTALAILQLPPKKNKKKSQNKMNDQAIPKPTIDLNYVQNLEKKLKEEEAARQKLEGVVTDSLSTLVAKNVAIQQKKLTDLKAAGVIDDGMEKSFTDLMNIPGMKNSKFLTEQVQRVECGASVLDSWEKIAMNQKVADQKLEHATRVIEELKRQRLDVEASQPPPTTSAQSSSPEKFYQQASDIKPVIPVSVGASAQVDSTPDASIPPELQVLANKSRENLLYQLRDFTGE